MSTLRVVLALTLGVGLASPPHVSQAPSGQSTGRTGPQTGHAVAAYDTQRGRVVLVGGPGDPVAGVRDHVWTWDGTRWEPADSPGPIGRVNASAAYDAARRRVIVAGGSRKSETGAWGVVGDSWQGDRTGWRQMADISPRDHHALVEDSSGRVLMFGGIPGDRSAPWPRDTWQLDGEGWRCVAADGPVARGRTALAYDSKRRQVVLFGGVTEPPAPKQPQAFLNDTWIWDGATWTQATTDGPRGRYAHAMVYDERAGVVLLYGGAAAHSGAPLEDMWKWDGRTWTEITQSGPTPGHRYQPVMVYDKARDRTVLYGGIASAGDTWEWDGQRWRRID